MENSTPPFAGPDRQRRQGAGVTTMQSETMNLPAASDPAAIRNFPDARNAERDALLDDVRLFPGMTTLDIQSAGGYLSDEIHRRLAGDVTCICIEPSDALRNRLNPAFRAFADPVERFTSVADGTVDAVLGLAGLHHSDSHADTINESWRVLKNSGQVAICDVEVDSHVARWLNEFVNDNSSAGHEGRFVREGDMTRLFTDAGFTGVRECRRRVPWVFENRAQVVQFFRGLFDLRCAPEEIDTALDRYFTFEERDGRFLVDWSLLYASGQK